MDFRKIRGQSGESIALAYLEERGFRLIERNWNCRLGEIDLIVERGRGDPVYRSKITKNDGIWLSGSLDHKDKIEAFKSGY
jgi:Holliday junction resolvase-like predicted endonuclease